MNIEVGDTYIVAETGLFFKVHAIHDDYAPHRWTYQLLRGLANQHESNTREL
jgi:hypothetical protein